MGHWAQDAIFYHIYPLGLCGAPAANDFSSAPVPRLEQLHGWLDHLEELGVNAVYLGPVFESGTHGYDTADYHRVDRRLGDGSTLAGLSAALHRRGMRLVLDGVFHHVGRDFWAFRDVRQRLEGSDRRGWFRGLSFGGRSPYGDPFTYEGWDGHLELVRLELRNRQVVEHLLGAVDGWIREYGIDGLRLDAADRLDAEFLQELAGFCRRRRPDFWLLGEAVHGDYRRLANPSMLDSVTNYECYKGLWSSHNDRNYFEIAYALERQFGGHGLYRDLPLYAFADNHDVNRVASTLRRPEHLAPLYTLLFTMPGVPSLYYGSEWGIGGLKRDGSDRALRPALEPPRTGMEVPRPELPALIARLARARRSSRALRRGSYRPLHVSGEQLAFCRQAEGELAVAAVNAADRPVTLELQLPPGAGATLLADALQPGAVPVRGGRLSVELPANGGRVLVCGP